MRNAGDLDAFWLPFTPNRHFKLAPRLAIDIESDPQAAGRRGYEAMRLGFMDEQMVLRVAGDTIAFAPALISTQAEIDRMIDGVRRILERLD